MGDKRRAKRAAAGAGVPVVPAGDAGPSTPVGVKAVAGGGGKGMRVVHAPERARRGDERPPAARRCAAFGEDAADHRALPRARRATSRSRCSADRHGTVVHLGERECSLQRRHQKVVEEAPSPGRRRRARGRGWGGGGRARGACGYVGAGTVEFIATADGEEFFFLEMNTRLQVEHPVTELVYGVDLVEQQLRIAAGEPLTLRQDELVPRGHASRRGSTPRILAKASCPRPGRSRSTASRPARGMRVDSGIDVGSEIGTAYDPMLAKVIAHGPDRASARRRLDRALADFDLLGVATNAAFTRSLLDLDAVRSGQLDTGLLERALRTWDAAPPADLLPAAALAAAGTATPDGPWRRDIVDHGEVRVSGGAVMAAGRVWEDSAVRILEDGRARVRLDGVERRYLARVTPDAVWIAREGHQLELRTRTVAGHDEGELVDSLLAPMPGTVLVVHVADGEHVERGQTLLVLESMKMELAIDAPHAGVVAEMRLRVGDRVALREPLLQVHAVEAQ